MASSATFILSCVISGCSALRAAPLAPRMHIRGRSSAIQAKQLEGNDAALYAFGTNIGRQISEINVFSEKELDVVLSGIKDILIQAEPKCELGMHVQNGIALFQARTEEAAERTKDAGSVALELAAQELGAIKTSSGLVYQELSEGTGESPTADDQVKVHYEGKLVDGTVFDSSYKRGAPLEFGVNGVIPGWIEGLQLMKPGGKAKLTIPSDLAYGDQGTGPIPPKATLTFVIELLAVNS